jgi:formylglycine-generating enzyme required for sulfatase activity
MEQRGRLSRLFGGFRAATRRVEPFDIAKYPVTWVQYRAFLEADDGFKDPTWWEACPFQIDQPGRQFNPRDNHPAENLCWYEAVAFWS